MSETIAADRARIADYRRNPLVMSGLPIFDLKLTNNGANNMPSATDTTARPLAQMAPTPGVTPEHEVQIFTKPVLFPDIDVVKLVRLYGAEATAEALRAAAMKAGEAALKAAPDVVASQQVPVSGQEGQPPPVSPGVAPAAPPPHPPAAHG
jgi:hypothetical protein